MFLFLPLFNTTGILFRLHNAGGADTWDWVSEWESCTCARSRSSSLVPGSNPAATQSLAEVLQWHQLFLVTLTF